MRHATVKCTSVGARTASLQTKNLGVDTLVFTTAERVAGWRGQNEGLRTLRTRTYPAVPLAPVLQPQIGRAALQLSQARCSPKAERDDGSTTMLLTRRAACGPATPPRVTESSRPAARPMARPRDGADQQKRRHPIASTQGQLGLGRGPPPRRGRRRRESAGPREGESRGPARLV